MHALAAPARRIADLPAPPGLPVVGNALQIDLPHFHQQLEAWRRSHGDAYRLRIWSRELVVIGDPQLTAEALRERPGTFSRVERMVRAATEMGFGGVFASNGEKWRRQRPMVMAAFDPGHVRRYFPALAQVAARLARRWNAAAVAGHPIELQRDLMRYTVDVISGLAFGTDINTLENEREAIQEHMDRIFPMLSRRIFAPFPWWRYVKLPADRRLDRHLAAFHRAIEGFIAAARARIEADPTLREAPGNLIEAMVAARDRPGHALRDEDVAANVGTMLLAGEDTTANTLAWMLYLLAQHPAALERATAEVRQVLAGDRLPTRFEQVQQLEFVEACAHETMRLKPVAPMLLHQAEHDTTLGGIAIPKGTTCLFLMRAGATDARHFERPEAFDPGRWLRDEAAAAKRIAMPFGAGPRTCPGRYLALLEIKVAIATVLGGFELRSVSGADGQPIEERYAFTMGATPLHMRLAPR